MFLTLQAFLYVKALCIIILLIWRLKNVLIINKAYIIVLKTSLVEESFIITSAKALRIYRMVEQSYPFRKKKTMIVI